MFHLPPATVFSSTIRKRLVHVKMQFWLISSPIISAEDDPGTHGLPAFLKDLRHPPVAFEGRKQGRPKVVSHPVCFCYFFPFGPSRVSWPPITDDQTTAPGQQ
jgi:hypothetical protein